MNQVYGSALKRALLFYYIYIKKSIVFYLLYDFSVL